MAAAVVAGLIPVLHSVAGDKSGYYIGRQLWFGLIAMYGVVVYVVHMPWVHVYEDFWCHGNITYPCLMECFENSYTSSVTGTWYLFYLLFLIFFFLMEFVMAQMRHKHLKVKSVEAVVVGVEEGSMVGIQEQVPSSKKSTLNFHRERILLLSYLLHYLLQIGFQCFNLFILMYKHLPMVTRTTIHCSTDDCPGPYLCLFRATMEKRMSIYTLITLSLMIIVFCLSFFIYSVYHYVLRGLSIFRFWMD